MGSSQPSKSKSTISHGCFPTAGLHEVHMMFSTDLIYDFKRCSLLIYDLKCLDIFHSQKNSAGLEGFQNRPLAYFYLYSLDSFPQRFSHGSIFISLSFQTRYKF